MFAVLLALSALSVYGHPELLLDDMSGDSADDPEPADHEIEALGELLKLLGGPYEDPCEDSIIRFNGKTYVRECTPGYPEPIEMDRDENLEVQPFYYKSFELSEPNSGCTKKKINGSCHCYTPYNAGFHIPSADNLHNGPVCTKDEACERENEQCDSTNSAEEEPPICFLEVD